MHRLTLLAVLCVLIRAPDMPVHAAEAAADDVAKGRALSLKLCTPCHVVSPDQEMAPILRPPAASFHSIANKPATTAESLHRFLTQTHRSLGRPGGMPNPELTDAQVRQETAFLMSLKGQR